MIVLSLALGIVAAFRSLDRGLPGGRSLPRRRGGGWFPLCYSIWVYAFSLPLLTTCSCVSRGEGRKGADNDQPTFANRMRFIALLSCQSCPYPCERRKVAYLDSSAPACITTRAGAALLEMVKRRETLLSVQLGIFCIHRRITKGWIVSCSRVGPLQKLPRVRHAGRW